MIPFFWGSSSSTVGTLQGKYRSLRLAEVEAEDEGLASKVKGLVEDLNVAVLSNIMEWTQ